VLNFILIDDNKIDLLIASKALHTCGVPFGWIEEFNNAIDALECIKTVRTEHHCVVFIDIQMPVMNGFAFMEAYQTLDENIRKQFTCMYLTSSLNDIDRLRALKYSEVKAFVNKPLTSKKIKDTFQELNIL
jgi:CheY-like chemotaxis protein